VNEVEEGLELLHEAGYKVVVLPPLVEHLVLHGNAEAVNLLPNLNTECYLPH